MLRLHREGTPTIVIIGLVCLMVSFFLLKLTPPWNWILLLLPVGFFLFIVQFFKYPYRQVPEIDEKVLIAPADGKVVVIEQVDELEYLQTTCTQISIFMSPLNVHVNWNPIGGIIEYFKYHAGKYLVAWHPKSSTENERTTIVYNHNGQKILVRQIAGAVARRIVNYIQSDSEVERGGEMGFIKFGSRVDILVPPNAEILVELDQKVKGKVTEIARLV